MAYIDDRGRICIGADHCTLRVNSRTNTVRFELHEDLDGNPCDSRIVCALWRILESGAAITEYDLRRV